MNAGARKEPPNPMMRTFLHRTLVLCAAVVPFTLAAQDGVVRGFVYEAETGEPAIFTNVFLQGTTIGAATDVNGYFSLTRVPAGTHTLMVTYVGFDTLSKSISIKADQILTEKLFIKKASVTLRMFEVSAEKQEAQQQVRMAVTRVEPKQIERMPAVGGEKDLAQYLQMIPGVIFTGDQGGQLYIRGGSPIMNKVMLDGMVLYNPFHSIGLFSVFDNDIIRNADIFTGGFNAEHGGRISSVMDITTRDGNKTRLAGKVAASTFAGKVLLEGPMKKQTDPGSSSSSFLINARHSYLSESSKALYSYVDTAGLPFGFTDLFGKLSFNGANGSKFNLFGFNFSDKVEYRNVSDLAWNNWGAAATFVLVPQGSAVLIDGVFAVSNYRIQLDERDLEPRASEVAGFNGGLNFKYFTGDNEARYGIELLGFRTDFNFFNSAGNLIQQVENTTEFAGYFNYRWNMGKAPASASYDHRFVLDPGLRVHYYASLAVANVEPRMGFKWNINDNLRFKAAAGRYSQNLVAANSDRDVVNLFYGFLSSPTDLPEEQKLPDGSTRAIKDGLQRSAHYLAGFEIDPTRDITLNLEGWYKDFQQVTNLNRNKVYEDTDEFQDKPDELKKDFIVESGEAYGADLTLKYEKGGTYFWAVYSLSYVKRFDGTIEYNPIWDRRHNVNLLASHTFGKFDSWKASVRFNFGTGFPFTQTQGFYESDPFNTNISADYHTTNGELGTLYARLNDGRLPDYGRVDLGLTKTWKLDERRQVQVDFGITNVADRDNIFYYDRVRGTRVNQLPILPSLGASYSF